MIPTFEYITQKDDEMFHSIWDGNRHVHMAVGESACNAMQGVLNAEVQNFHLGSYRMYPTGSEFLIMQGERVVVSVDNIHKASNYTVLLNDESALWRNFNREQQV